MGSVVVPVDLHGRKLEVGCYGSGSDWLCRVTDPTVQPAEVNDAYYPPPDLGFFWVRECDGLWLASGMVSQDVFRDAGTIDRVLYAVMEQAVRSDDQLASCVELVEPKFTSIVNGEEGAIFFTGGGAGCRFGPR